MKLPYEEFDLSGVKTYPLRSRQSKVSLAQICDAVQEGTGVDGLLTSLPATAGRAGLQGRGRGDRRREARRTTAIIWGSARTCIKTGLSPVLVDLMERGFVSAIATNGAGIIHDFEIALVGRDLRGRRRALGPGTFGMAEETGRAAESRDQRRRRGRGSGIGQSVGRFLADAAAAVSRRTASRAAAWRLQIPVTVHVAIGTDIIHMHPQASGAAIGEGSLRDFRYFVSRSRGSRAAST